MSLHTTSTLVIQPVANDTVHGCMYSASLVVYSDI